MLGLWRRKLHRDDRYPRAVVSQLAVPDRIREELQRRLVLIYLGRPHSSSAVHDQVVRELERRGPDCAPLEALRAAAERARDALLAGDFGALGSAMRDNTRTQAELHAGLVHRDAWRVIEIAEAHGAAGCKVNGAGGDGGSITHSVRCRSVGQARDDTRDRRDNPAWASIPIAISRKGLRVWCTEAETPGAQKLG